MEGLFFNVSYGYLEGVVRGYKAGLIKSNQYVNLTQCDSLDDVKLQLSATDYGNFLANFSGVLTTSVIADSMNEVLNKEFRYLQQQASGVATEFINYITYGYMIDNVMLMITGTLHDRDRSEILAKCNPLGWFDTLPTISIATDIDSLYETVLIDTPLAPFFQGCLSVDDLDDLNIEIVRNRLYKNYLEAFAQFIQDKFIIPDSEIMENLLSFEADKRVINIALNSLNNPDFSAEDKLSLFPKLGLLQPYHQQLADCDDGEQLKSIVDNVGVYAQVFAEDNSNQNLEDHFYFMEMQFCKDGFTQQFTLSSIYCWLKSKEQEIRNVTWISECIAQHQKQRIDNYISVY